MISINKRTALAFLDKTKNNNNYSSNNIANDLARLSVYNNVSFAQMYTFIVALAYSVIPLSLATGFCRYSAIKGQKIT